MSTHLISSHPLAMIKKHALKIVNFSKSWTFQTKITELLPTSILFFLDNLVDNQTNGIIRKSITFDHNSVSLSSYTRTLAALVVEPARFSYEHQVSQFFILVTLACLRNTTHFKVSSTTSSNALLESWSLWHVNSFTDCHFCKPNAELSNHSALHTFPSFSQCNSS